MKTKIFLILAVILATSFNLNAQEISVVDVKRNITLSDDDEIYKDFYLNIGDSSALKKNLVVNIKRKIEIKDTGSKSVGQFETLVGQLKIIHVGNKVAVAREHKLIPRDEEPMLEQIGIMVGDTVDTNGSFIDTSKPVKKKTAEVLPVLPTAEPVETADAKSVQTPENKVENTEQQREPATQQLPPQNPIPIPEI